MYNPCVAAKRFNPEEFLPEIHAWIESGNTLRAYCRQDGKPSYSTVYDWLEADAKTTDKPASTRFERARAIGESVILQECLEIADNTQVGEIITTKGDGTKEIKTADMLEHRRLRIDTRLKLLAKWNPKKYGEKVAHTGEEGGPVRFVLERIGEKPAE